MSARYSLHTLSLAAVLPQNTGTQTWENRTLDTHTLTQNAHSGRAHSQGSAQAPYPAADPYCCARHEGGPRVCAPPSCRPPAVLLDALLLALAAREGKGFGS